MRLRILFVDNNISDSTTMPNAMVVTDEFAEDSWGGVPDWYRDAALKECDGSDPESEAREAFVEIPDQFVRDLFKRPTIYATVVDDVIQ